LEVDIEQHSLEALRPGHGLLMLSGHSMTVLGVSVKHILSEMTV